MRSGLGNSPTDPLYARNVASDGTPSPSGNAGDPGYVTESPNGSANGSIVPVKNGGVSALTGKGTAGNFYGASCTASTTAGFLIVYDANALPAVNAVLTQNLLVYATPIAANGIGTAGSGAGVPDRCTAGIQIFFSTSTTTRTDPAALPLHMRARFV